MVDFQEPKSKWQGPQPRGYKLCKGCGQPILKKNQKRKEPEAYRHAQGCPLGDGT